MTDQAAALQLANFSKSAASALVNLRNAANRAGESFTALNVDNALDLLANVKGNLKDVERSVAEGTIKPLPRETVSILYPGSGQFRLVKRECPPPDSIFYRSLLSLISKLSIKKSMIID